MPGFVGLNMEVVNISSSHPGPPSHLQVLTYPCDSVSIRLTLQQGKISGKYDAGLISEAAEETGEKNKHNKSGDYGF